MERAGPSLRWPPLWELPDSERESQADSADSSPLHSVVHSRQDSLGCTWAARRPAVDWVVAPPPLLPRPAAASPSYAACEA